MSVELEAKKITVATAQKDCEELLVEIVSERRVADEQKKQVRVFRIKSIRILISAIVERRFFSNRLPKRIVKKMWGIKNASHCSERQRRGKLRSSLTFETNKIANIIRGRTRNEASAALTDPRA